MLIQPSFDTVNQWVEILRFYKETIAEPYDNRNIKGKDGMGVYKIFNLGRLFVWFEAIRAL